MRLALKACLGQSHAACFSQTHDATVTNKEESPASLFAGNQSCTECSSYRPADTAPELRASPHMKDNVSFLPWPVLRHRHQITHHLAVQCRVLWDLDIEQTEAGAPDL